MEVDIRAITPETASHIEQTSARSMFWVVPGEEYREVCNSPDATFDKQVWIQSVLMNWGICGYTAFVSTGDKGATEVPAATVFFAPAHFFPGTMVMPTAPVSPDAILISTVHVNSAYMGLYLEQKLLETVLTEAQRRGIKAVEVFARNEEAEELWESEEDWDPEGHWGVTSRWATQDHRERGDRWGDDECCGEEDATVGRHSSIHPSYEDHSLHPTNIGRHRHSLASWQPMRSVESSSGDHRLFPRSAGGDPGGYHPEAYGGWRDVRRDPTGDHREDWISTAPLLSSDILDEEGFEVKKPHPHYPLYRREIDSPGHLFAQFEDCLLYTSPSPRD